MKKSSYSLLAILAAILAYITGKPPVAPNPTPSPTPTASATATVSPTVAPTAIPTPSLAETPAPTPPLEYLCKLPPVVGESVCNEKPTEPEDHPTFMDAVMSAQDSAEENGFVKDGKVTNEVGYTNEVVRILRVSGYCAINGRQGGHTSDDEVWVKNSNSFSEHYDIVTARREPWTNYAAICRKAKF